MLGFVVTLKHPDLVTAPEKYSQLLKRCIWSLRRQISDKSFVVLVGNMVPAAMLPFGSGVYFHRVDLPPPPRERFAMNADKTKKLLAGSRFAIDRGASHIMIVDSDDCVSNKVAEFVDKNPHSPGWVFKKGYLYKEGRSVSWLNHHNFHVSCGSSVIFRHDLQSAVFHDFLTIGKPHYTLYSPQLADGTVLEWLPFPGAVYSIANGENIFLTANCIAHFRRKESPVAYYWRKVQKYRPVVVTSGMRAEFGL